MIDKRIPPGKAIGYSDFYLDFLSAKSPASNFFGGDPATVSHQIDKHFYRRAELVDILLRQNTTFNSDPTAIGSVKSLTANNAVCVFAGQQAGLFTGPLLVIIKALGVVKFARQYSRQLNRPVIPIFWIAGDDHDFDEIASTVVLNQQAELVDLRYGVRPTTEIPASEIKFVGTDELARVLTTLKTALGQTDFTPELYSCLDECYQPGETFVSAFGKMLARITAGTGLVLFNPCDAQVKALAAPLFERIVDAQPELHRSLAETNEALTSAGYHKQVEGKEDSALLFMTTASRRPVHRTPTGFAAGDRQMSAGDLKAAIRSNPEQFSPDVMTRPVMQSYLFPVVCQLGGPAEIAYLAQCRRFFQLLDIPAPIHRGRPTATLLEPKIGKLADEYGVTFDELFGDIELVVNRVMAATFPKDLEQGYAGLTKDIEERWRQFAASSLAFDPSLAEFAKQTFGKIDFTLKGFEAKLFAAHKKKGKEIRERIYRIGHHLAPRRTLQERTLNITCYLSKYGFGMAPYLLEQLEEDQPAHQIIALSERSQS